MVGPLPWSLEPLAAPTFCILFSGRLESKRGLTCGSPRFLIYFLSKLSQASVTDLSQKMTQSQDSGQLSSKLSSFKNILGKITGGGNDQKANQAEQMQQQSQGYNFNPDNICPPEVKQRLLDVLKWHDDVMRDITKRIEMVPGLTNLLEEFSNSLNECASLPELLSIPSHEWRRCLHGPCSLPRRMLP